MLLQLWHDSHDPRDLDDFITYWTAGRLNAQGIDPYDADHVLELQRRIGWTKPFAYRIWYPPWTIGLLMPLAALPAPAARFVWHLFGMAAIAGCADWLWRAYGGDPAKRGVAWLVAATFSPAAIVWKTGQVAPIMLLGVVAFLAWTRARRPVLAGASLALAAAKPQLAYLVWPALVLTAARTGDFRSLLWLGGTLGMLLGAALIANPDVLAQFIALNRAEPPHLPQPPYVLPSAAGSALRWAAVRIAGTDIPILQFVPMLAGGAWLLWYWRRRRHEWSWLEDMPLVLLVSFATTPWCWVYDEVLLVVPLIHAAVALTARAWGPAERRLVAAYVAVDLVILAADVAHAHATSYVWTQYALLALYLAMPWAPPAASSGVPMQTSPRTLATNTDRRV